MSKAKEGTARIAMYHELQIPNIFTMEASFCGASMGALKGKHFTTDNLMNAGHKLLEALIVYSKIDIKQNVNELYSKIKKGDIEQELTANKKLISMTQGGEGNSSGSDSEPSADNLDDDEMEKIAPIVKKKPVPKPELPKKPPPPKVVIPKKPASPKEK